MSLRILRDICIIAALVCGAFSMIGYRIHASRLVEAHQNAEDDGAKLRWWLIAGMSPNRQFHDGVSVYDLAGVCLYLAADHAHYNADRAIAMVAVPKTQLPVGAGCQ